jgi:secreted PhoX family phosphatase
LLHEASTRSRPGRTVVPHTGDVFLQEDAEDDQYIRGVNRRGEIYDFAHTVLNNTEFCGGCFSPDGQTFFVNQQGDRVDVGADPALGPRRSPTRSGVRSTGVTATGTDSDCTQSSSPSFGSPRLIATVDGFGVDGRSPAVRLPSGHQLV